MRPKAASRAEARAPAACGTSGGVARGTPGAVRRRRRGRGRAGADGAERAARRDETLRRGTPRARARPRPGRRAPAEGVEGRGDLRGAPHEDARHGPDVRGEELLDAVQDAGVERGVRRRRVGRRWKARGRSRGACEGAPAAGSVRTIVSTAVSPGSAASGVAARLQPVEVAVERIDVGVSLVAALRHHLADHAAEPLRERPARTCAGPASGCTRCMDITSAPDVPSERRVSRHEVVQRRAEGVDVRARVDVPQPRICSGEM